MDAANLYIPLQLGFTVLYSVQAQVCKSAEAVLASLEVHSINLTTFADTVGAVVHFQTLLRLKAIAPYTW